MNQNWKPLASRDKIIMAVNLYLQANLCPEIIHSLSKCFLLQCNLEYLFLIIV